MSSKDNTQSDEAWGIVKRIFKRIGINVLAFMAGLLAIRITHSQGYYPMQSGWYSVLFTTWVSVVCLCPGARRGIKDPDWYVPVGAGLLSTAAAVVTGLPWQVALLFGGAQTWLQRLFALKSRMLWDFSALPFLLASMILWSDLFYYWQSLLTFPLVAIAGVLVHRSVIRMTQREENRKNLQRLVDLFEKKGGSALLSDAIREALGHLLVNLRRYISLNQNAAHDNKLLLGLDSLGSKLDNMEKAYVGGSVPDTFSFLKKGADKTDDNTLELATQSVLCDLRDFNDSLKEDIKKFEKDIPKPQDDLTVYEDKTDAMLKKSAELPSQIVKHLECIAESTRQIIAQMRNDPQDRQYGDSFLRRYFKHVEEIFRECLRLRENQDQHYEELLTRACGVLERLSKAFEDENRYLHENDNLNFRAELDALDEFLKMRGH